MVLHTPSGEQVGTRIEIDAPVFTLGSVGADLAVEGAAESGTQAKLVRKPGEQDAALMQNILELL